MVGDIYEFHDISHLKNYFDGMCVLLWPTNQYFDINDAVSVKPGEQVVLLTDPYKHKNQGMVLSLIDVLYCNVKYSVYYSDFITGVNRVCQDPLL